MSFSDDEYGSIEREFEVTAPSGAAFQVLNAEEVRFFNDVAARYQQHNHFVNVSDLLELDRLLIMETMCLRWGTWLSQESDYEGNSVDLTALSRSLNDLSKEIRLVKKQLTIDKAGRDREKGANVADYLENLRARAKEFGVMREDQLTKALTLFHELKALLILHDNCDEIERKENDIELDDLIDWIRKVAVPEFDAIDEYFTTHQQKFWRKEL